MKPWQRNCRESRHKIIGHLKSLGATEEQKQAEEALAAFEEVVRGAFKAVKEKADGSQFDNNSDSDKFMEATRTEEAGVDFSKREEDEPYGYDRYPLGRVVHGLADREVELVKADANHGFANYKEAKEWA